MGEKAFRTCMAMLPFAMAAGLAGRMSVHAATRNGWEYDVDGKYTYWYEGGIRQGTEGRGKEIYYPNERNWYWLDAAEDGLVARNKDVYQESAADSEGNTGKWVRYDGDGHMVKGWNITGAGAYYFDPVYGTMAKGSHHIDGVDYFFNEVTGIMESCSIGMDAHWETMEGNQYWYEGGIRQGYDPDPDNPYYRGKEIYDPGSDAWYWLDNVQQGAKAVSKDVYQESQADAEGNMGKWVRYDADGHMLKGWHTDENGTYYFDPVYGTMAHGTVKVDGKPYWFDLETGICENEGARNEYDDIGRVLKEYDTGGNLVKYHTYETVKGSGHYWEYQYDNAGRLLKFLLITFDDREVLEWTDYENDVNGNCVKSISYDGDGNLDSWIDFEYDQNNNETKQASYGKGGNLTHLSEHLYDQNNILLKETEYSYQENGELEKSIEIDYDYDDNGRLIHRTSHSGYIEDSGFCRYYTLYDYDYDETGTLKSYNSKTYTEDEEIRHEAYYEYYGYSEKQVKNIFYGENGKEITEWFYDERGHEIKKVNYLGDGNMTDCEESEYNIYDECTSITWYNAEGKMTSRLEYQYDEKGNLIETILTYYDAEGNITNLEESYS